MNLHEWLICMLNVGNTYHTWMVWEKMEHDIEHDAFMG